MASKKELTPEEIKEVSEAFIMDRTSFISSYPFYGILLLELTALVGTEVPIAGINYKNIVLQGRTSTSRKEPTTAYHSISRMGREALLAHEILHLVFEHLSIPMSFDYEIANIAQDAVINRILANDPNIRFSELPKGVVTPYPYGITIGKGVNQVKIPIPNYYQKDWVPIYHDILKFMKNQHPDLSESEIGELLKSLNPINGDCSYNDESQGDLAEREQAAFKFQQKFISVVESCKAQGSIPAELDRYASSLRKGKVSWVEHLRQMVRTKMAKNDFSWKRNSRRSHLGFFPRVESNELADIVVALDTSGSMSQEDLNDGLSEFVSLRATEPFNFHFVSCDHKAYEMKSYDSTEEPEWDQLPIKGGGGTSFEPVFDLIEEKKKEGLEPVLLVYFTDTMGTFPKYPPEYPVIWVTNYTRADVPFGTLIKIDRG